MFQATLVGNLGQDPAEKDINGSKFVEASIAVKCGKDHTEWVNLSLYGKQGEIFKQYMSKGKQVVVTGSISFYSNKEGKKYTQMRVSDFTMLGGASGQSASEQRPAAPEKPKSNPFAAASDSDGAIF